ncbi:hypothetical protein CCD83_07295 [Neisseria meningitidis]|nr:hypothetical protein CCD83_07295 [Neisseria meningitidis]
MCSRHSRAGGNLVCSVSVISDKCLLLFISRFPRRRESRISMPQEFIGKNQNPSAVIPTKVGI